MCVLFFANFGKIFEHELQNFTCSHFYLHWIIDSRIRTKHHSGAFGSTIPQSVSYFSAGEDLRAHRQAILHLPDTDFDVSFDGTIIESVDRER
jgi:hypothetical protein